MQLYNDLKQELFLVCSLYKTRMLISAFYLTLQLLFCSEKRMTYETTFLLHAHV